MIKSLCLASSHILTLSGKNRPTGKLLLTLETTHIFRPPPVDILHLALSCTQSVKKANLSNYERVDKGVLSEKFSP